jgi:hypothetical protein
MHGHTGRDKSSDASEHDESESDSNLGSLSTMKKSIDTPLRAVLVAPQKGQHVCFRSTTLEGWPEDVQYTHTLDMSGLSASDKRSLRIDSIPGVFIRRYRWQHCNVPAHLFPDLRWVRVLCDSIDDPAHPACGQRGLFAAQRFRIGDVIGEYTGKVVPRNQRLLKCTMCQKTNHDGLCCVPLDSSCHNSARRHPVLLHR